MPFDLLYLFILIQNCSVCSERIVDASCKRYVLSEYLQSACLLSEELESELFIGERPSSILSLATSLDGFDILQAA